MLRRPSVVYIDSGRCIECGLCEQISPGLLSAGPTVPVSELILDAMAACPTAAIRWSEGELQDEAARRA